MPIAVEGYGRTVTGGAGGTSIVINSLANSGVGSLRDALVGVKSNRIITFHPDLVGSIALTGSDNFNIQGNNITVDGESNPNVNIIGRGFRVEGQNHIYRHLRFRITDGQGVDNFGLLGGAADILIEHCSFAQGADECASFTGSIAGINGTVINRVTFQYNIIGPGLQWHGGEIGGGESSKGSLWSVCNFVSAHHNIWYKCYHRMPRLTSQGGAATDLSYDMRMNMHVLWGECPINDTPSLDGTRLEYNAVGVRCNLIQEYWTAPGQWATYDQGFRIFNAVPTGQDGSAYSRGLLRDDRGTFTHQAKKQTEYDTNERVRTYDIRREIIRILANAGAQPRDAMDAATIADITSRITISLLQRPIFGIGCGIASPFAINGDRPGPIQVIG